MTFDLLPLELNIEPLIRRLLVALRDSPDLHVSELRRVLARGRTERVWAASSYDDEQSTSDRPLALALVVLLPALICTCLGLSARKQREAASAAVARDMPPMHRGFSIPSCARVRYALNGGEDSTEVTLSLTKIHSVKELESTIVQGMPRDVPHNAELLIAFEDSSGEQRQLNSPSTCLQEALLASSFDVSCTRTRRNGRTKSCEWSDASPEISGEVSRGWKGADAHAGDSVSAEGNDPRLKHVQDHLKTGCPQKQRMPPPPNRTKLEPMSLTRDSNPGCPPKHRMPPPLPPRNFLEPALLSMD